MTSERGAEALEELRIRFRQVSTDRYLVLANGPATAAEIIDWRTTVSFVDELDKLFQEAFGEQPRASTTPIDARLTELGRELFGALLPPSIRDCLEKSIGIARAEKCELRLRFDLPAPLSDLPVEILCSPLGDPIGALALNATLSIVRSVHPIGREESENPRLPKPQDDEEPLSILVVVASPRGRPPLEVTAELNRLERAIRRPLGFKGVDLDVLGGPNNNDRATLTNLHNRVKGNGNPLAVLLIAHGETSPDHSQACVVLESDDRSAQPIPADRLGGILGNSVRVRFVALNLCVGARVVGREPLSGVAQAIISNGIPAVVGMSTEVTDEAGARFSAPLFRALAYNETIDDAVQAGRIEMDNIRADTRIEWCAPVLCMEDDCLRGRLFKVTSLDAKADPLQEGLKVTERFTKRPSSDDLITAIMFHRATKNWVKVHQLTDSPEEAQDPQRRACLERLAQEASIELAIKQIDELCRRLASNRPTGELTRPELDSGVPEAVVKCLDREVARANERRRLRQQYGKGRKAEDKEDWAAAVTAYEPFEQHEYLDGRQRLAYAMGRLAEAEQRWVDARAAYGEVGNGLPDTDVSLRRLYVQGRAAELDDDWSTAAETYAALPAGQRDCDQRLPYAQGRAAEQAGDWPQVLAALSALAANYRDAPLRRGYATARVAEQNNAWTEVIEALAGLDEVHIGRLRTYAEARQAEDDDHWDRAVELYRALGTGERDVALRQPYAQGRAAQVRGNWVAAVKVYQDVPDGYRDTAARRCHVTARHAEQLGDWASAVRAYQVIPQHPDTAERLPYAEACLADTGGDSKAVVNALDGHRVAEDLRDPARLLCSYARGRVTEGAGHWREAAQTYRACGQFRDAPARAGYMEGRYLEERADWTEALVVYESVAENLTEAHQAASRMTKLRDNLPWMDGLPRRGLAADPADHASPYHLLRGAGITPTSTAEHVKDASFVLMAGGLWTPEVRIAWDRLRCVADRLEVDALLYRLADGPGLARAQRRLASDAPDSPEGLVACLRRLVDRDAPLLSLLHGQREAAIEEWEQRLGGNLADVGAVHALALAWTWHAVELASADRHEAVAQAWERAIAYWGRVLSDDAYWVSWRSERASCYEFAISAADLSRARRGLVERLFERLTALADRCRADGQAEHAQRYRRLRLTLAVELVAARALADAGGLPGDAGSMRFACGPLFARLYPELRGPLGHLVARLDAQDAAEPALSASPLLRCTFSELGEAIVLLEQNRPDRALEALGDRYHDKIVDLPADCGHELAGNAVDCAECVEFQEHNPAHAGLRHRRTRVLQDAVDLRIRALLALAQAALMEGRPGVDTALARWQEAIEVAANIGTSVRIKQAIVPVVLGRADVLKEEHWGDRRTGERLTEAIHLVAAARALVGNVDEGQLTAQEAELLTLRGIWYGFWCYKYEEPSYQRGTDDLRHALTLNPDSLDTRDNLTHGLVNWACSLRHQSSAGRQLRLLGDAFTIVHVGLVRTSGYALFEGTLTQVLNELEQWCFDELSDEELDRRLRESPTSLMTDGPAGAERLIRDADRELETHPAAGVLNLIAAVRLDPRPEVRQRLTDAITWASGRLEWSEGC
jgi:hypothetical protein